MINDRVYQTILDEISKYLPIDWSKLVVYLEYGESSYSVSFYVKESENYIKCYDLNGISDEDLYQSFKKINNDIAVQRDMIVGEKWSNMTMVVERSGKMNVDFDYTDLTESAYQYSKEWKKKYLV